MHFSVLFLDCSVWENALHGCNSGGNAMLDFMGGMLGQGTHLKARRPALAYANVCLHVFPSLSLFI